MRVFWAVIGLLVLVGAGVVFLGRSGEGEGNEASTAVTGVNALGEETRAQRVWASVEEGSGESGTVESTVTPAPPPLPPDTQATEPAVATAAGTLTPAAEGTATTSPPVEEAASTVVATGSAAPAGDAPAIVDATTSQTAAGSSVEPHEEGSGAEPAEAAPVESDSTTTDSTNTGPTNAVSVGTESTASEPVAETNETVSATATEETPTSEPATAADAATTEAGSATTEPASVAAEEEAKKKLEIIESVFVTQEDGSVLADNRFVIKGKGTEAEPYRVTWDLLISAGETYNPRRGQLKLPRRIMMLSGKHVVVTGYVAFPIVADGPDEMLAMLNQWDGCCIGVPPTPYDAIEVRLKGAATAQEMLLNYGTVRGVMTVEPYLAGDWLLGLYMMEQATVTRPTE